MPPRSTVPHAPNPGGPTKKWIPEKTPPPKTTVTAVPQKKGTHLKKKKWIPGIPTTIKTMGVNITTIVEP